MKKLPNMAERGMIGRLYYLRQYGFSNNIGPGVRSELLAYSQRRAITATIPATLALGSK